MRSLSIVSREFVAYQVGFTDYNGVALDPSGDPVSIAFLAQGFTPASGDWHTATWLVTGTNAVAGILVGPGALVVAIGNYVGWVRPTDNPEIPAIPAGILQIY